MYWSGVGNDPLNDAETLTLTFESQPKYYNWNDKLGIEKDETYWKCYIANPPAPSDPNNPFEEEISLKASTTDRPRRVDTWFIEAKAGKGFTTFISFLILML